MSQETSSPTASPEKKALLDAFDLVLKKKADEREAEQQAALARHRARGTSRLVMLVSATLTLFLAVYLYVERPDWIFPAPPPPESLAVREASLRITMANAAHHIERFRHQAGQFPATLEQAGARGGEIRYDRTASGYRLAAESDEVQLRYESSEPLARFVGNSFKVISRRAK